MTNFILNVRQVKMVLLSMIRSMSKKPEQNFGLTEKEFNDLLRELKNDNTLLLEKIFLIQFPETVDYLMHRYRADQLSAYDATMEALLKFWQRLSDGKIRYGNMRFLFIKIAVQFLTKK